MAAYILHKEEFIKRMVQAGQRQAYADRRNMVNYKDMGMLKMATLPSPIVSYQHIQASTTQQYQEFMFLQGWSSRHTAK
jgi:hypothetical protein